MGRKTKEDAAKTRQLLIDTAILTFAQRGFSNTSLDDIAQAAKMTRGAIYWHFTNKTELFNAIWPNQLPVKDKISHKIALQYQYMPAILLRHSLIETLRLIVHDPLECALAEIIYHKCEFTQGMTSESEINERLFFSRDHLTPLLEQCVKDNPAFPGCDIDLAVIIIQAYMSGLVRNWLMLNKSFDLDRLAPRLVDTLLGMLRATPDIHVPGITPAVHSPLPSTISP